MMQNFIIKLIYKYTLQIILERYIFGKPRKMVIKLDVKAVLKWNRFGKLKTVRKIDAKISTANFDSLS